MGDIKFNAKSYRPKGPRGIAYQALRRVADEGSYLHIVLSGLLDEGLSDKDKGLATEIAYGAVRNMGSIDWILSTVSGRTKEHLSPGVQEVLQVAAYQILYLDRVPAYAAVNEAVEMTKKIAPFASGYVNAVLRKVIAAQKKGIKWPSFDADPVMHLAAAHSLPDWIARMWIDERGSEEAHELARAAGNQPQAAIRVNTLKSEKETVKAEFLNLGVETTDSDLAPEALILGETGARQLLSEDDRYTHQGTASMLAVHALEPRPGERIIDLCSAPGGKSTHAAALMENSGEIIAADKYAARLAQIDERATRLGVTTITTMESLGQNLPSKYEGWADRVLLDAPCTGLGILSRRPDLRWHKKPDDVVALAELQKELIDAAARYLKPGGHLLYCTCTISRRENQEVIEWALGQGGLKLEMPSDYLTPQQLSFVSPASDQWVELLPQIHGTDGFFIARMRTE